MDPLGFRFDVDAVLSGGVAHRVDCPLLASSLPPDAWRVAAGATIAAERCPGECAHCAPPFATVLLLRGRAR